MSWANALIELGLGRKVGQQRILHLVVDGNIRIDRVGFGTTMGEVTQWFFSYIEGRNKLY